MAYTVTKLITNAYYASGIVGREFQTVSGSQLNDGLDLVNEVLTDTFADSSMVPYYTKHTIDCVPDTERYYVENLIDIETITFFIDSVRFAMRKNDRNNYFGSTRANNIQSLPFNWHFEREKGGGAIYLYFKPDQDYPLEIWGQFGLTDVSLNTDLSLTYDQFYISYLKYALAVRLGLNFNYEVPMGIQKQLLEYELKIGKNIAPLDMRMEKISTLGKRNTLNYAQANLGKGWTASY